MSVKPDDTREELAEFIRHHAHRATREIPVVGSEDHPTPWDLRHRTINERLDDYEACKR